MTQFLKFNEWKNQQPQASQFNFNDLNHVTRIKDGELFKIGDMVYFRKSGPIFSIGQIQSFGSDNISVLIKHLDMGLSSKAMYWNEINDLSFVVAQYQKES